MAFEINDLKGILILVLFAMPMIASSNINCSGKAFHCVNSTHFMICVDLGGGLSTTIDDFVIPCPATTECHENNIFECDFPEVTTPPLPVIGVYKQSDTSELTPVTNSATTPMPTSKIFNVLKEKNTATTLPKPEEVTTVVKLEVLEDIKYPVGVNSDNTTETSFKVTSRFMDSANEIVNDKQASKNTVTTSNTDNKQHLLTAVETSIHEPVTTSSTDKSKSIDSVTSVIGLIKLISTDPRSEPSTMPPSDVLTSLDTNIYVNIKTTTEQYTAKQVLIQKENVTDKIVIPTGIMFTERSFITDEVSATPVVDSVDTYFENMNKNNLDNQTTVEQNALNKSYRSIDLVPETTTEYSATVKIVNISEPVNVVANPHTTTDNNLVPLGLLELSSGLNQTIRSTNLATDYLNTTATTTNNTAATVNQYSSKQETILTENPSTTEKVTTTPIFDTNHVSFNNYDVTNNSFTELNSTGDIITVEKVSETNLNSFITEPMIVESLQVTTDKVVSITTEANIRYNVETAISETSLKKYSTIDKQTIYTNEPLETITTTNSPIELTDNLYRINLDFNKSMTINPADTTNERTISTERINTVFNASSTDVNNNKVAEHTLLPQSTLKNFETEIPTSETLQNGFTTHGIEIKNELTATNAPFSVHETNMEIVGTNVLLSVHTTPAYDNATLEPDTITPVKDFISQSDVSVNKDTNITPEMIKASDGNTFLDPGTTQKVIAQQDVNVSGFLNQTGALVTDSEDSNAEQWTQTVQTVGVTTTYWNNYENSTTAPILSETTKNTSLSDSINTVRQDNISTKSVVNAQDILSKIIRCPTPPLNHVTEVSSIKPETVHIPSKTSISVFEQASTNVPNTADIYRASTTDYKTETSTTYPVDVTTVANDVTTNIENLTYKPITSLLQQELVNQESNIVRQLNSTTTATEKVSDFVLSTVTTSGYVLNTNDPKISNQTDSDKVKNMTPKVDSNVDISKTETINPINGEHNVAATSFSSTEKTNTDDSIKIVSVVDIVNSSMNAMPIGTLQSKSSKNSSSNVYITTKSQNSSNYVTATDNVPDYHLAHVVESITQKTPEAIVSMGETKVMNSVSSTPSTYTFPKTEINTEKVEYVSTEVPIPSTVELKLTKTVDYVAVKTNDNIFSSEAILTQLSKLPKVEASVSSLSNYTTGTAVPPDGVRIVPVNDEATTTRITASAFTMSSTQMAAKVVTDENIKTSTESSFSTLVSKVTQANKYNAELSLPILEVQAAQMTTEPTHTISGFGQTTPLDNKDQNVLPGTKVTDLPQNVMSTVNNNIPKSMESLPIAGVTASQISTQPTHTNDVFAQATPLIASASRTSQSVLTGIKTTGLPKDIMSIVNNNNPQPMPSLRMAGGTAAPMTTEPIHKNNVFAETAPTLATGRTDQDIVPGIKTTDLPQYVTTAKVTSYNPQSINNITTETISDSLTVPDSMVETIKVIEDKVSGTYFGDTALSDVMSNKPTVNSANYNAKSVKNVIDHESIVVGTTPKSNVQNTKSEDINRAEIVNHTKSDWMPSDVNIDSVKIKEASIEDENSETSVSKSGTDVQNKILVSNSSIMSKIEVKNGNPADRLITVTTNYKEEPFASKNATQAKTIFTKENKNAEIDSLVNGKIEIDVQKYQGQAISKNISDSYSINNTKTNITSSHHNLSLQNSTINDELEQHLLSTNHTITTEVQSHLNEGDKQSNKTNDSLTFNLTSEHNPNLTSIKLNASSKYNRAVTASDTVFDCSDHIRGKYADNKDCRKFYTCVGNLQPMLGICPNNTVFSEINKQCTRNLSHCVRNNQFRCLFEGRFPDFLKDKIYYICVKNRIKGFIRYKLQCQDNYHLNKGSVKCEKNEDISIQSASSVSETNNDDSKPTPKSEKMVSRDDFECENEGKFPYAKDCSKYYVCTKIKNVYQRKIKKCASDEIFDKKKKMCVESDSGEC